MCVLFFFISLGLIFYPVWSSWYLDNHQAELELKYEEQLQKKDDSEIREAWERAEEYNKAITPGASNESAFTQEAQLAAAKNYANVLNINGDSIMGYVEIPKIGVNLPIFHGTDENTLERGVGHLVGSSLPIGGDSTHAILTAHSGMASQKMFTNLEDMDIGDVFYVKVLGKKLAYQVDDINVVLPHEIADLYIAQGKDYVTLVTCTPYAVNTHRLLVRGTRIPYEEAVEIVEHTSTEEVNSSAWGKGYMKGIFYGLAISAVMLIVALIVVFVRKVFFKTGKYSRKPNSKANN